MRSMEFSGRSVDEAIFTGLNEMGVTIDEVEIETLKNETKGLFGLGAKQAVVRLTEREVPLSMEYEKAIQSDAAGRDARRPDARRERGGRDRRDDRRGAKPYGDRPDRRQERDRDAAPAIQYDYSAEKAADLPAAQFLSELLSKMSIEGNVLAADVDDGIRLNIDADTNGLLIGRRGETLDAVQYLVSLYANKDKKGDDYTRITLDTEGYRARREETLCRLARKNASQVRSTGRSIAMEPMNPYERRVLHSALADFSGVSTHSEGEEPNRRVVITPVEQ